MRLEPGPLQPLPEEQPPSAIEPGGFGDLARSEMTQGAAWENTLDSIGGALTTYTAEQPGDRLKSYVDPALAYANEVAADDPNSQFTTINADALTVDGALLGSYGNVPAEAWQQLPSALRTEPYENLPPQPGAISLQMGLPTNMASQAFTAGGPYRVVVQVTPHAGTNEEFANLRVQFNVYLRPNSPYSFDLGFTNAAGQLVYNGTFPADAAGAWAINPIIYGSIGVNGPTLQFTVAAAQSGGGGTGGGSQFPVSATITNLNTQSHTAFRVGDDFTLTIRGAPSADIALYIWKDGNFQGQGYLGTTDATGRFDYTGRFSATDVGSYIENYVVGGVQWNNSLVFTVSA